MTTRRGGDNGGMERYVGTRFRTSFLDRRPPTSEQAEELARWCRTFSVAGFSPPGEEAFGNLSVRQDVGFLVTPTHRPFLELHADELVHVLVADSVRLRVVARGQHEPTSETFLHHEIYRRRPDVGAVFHGHSDAILEAGARAGIVTTPREVPYGTLELAHLAANAAQRADVFLLRSHGFVTLGRTMEEAGCRAMELSALVANEAQDLPRSRLTAWISRARG